jgi:dTMP kinase
MSKGCLIALEGIDGSGKSTQVKLLAAALEALGKKVHITCEPTDGYIGKLIRQIFRGEIEGSHEVIAALFLADRLNHITNSSDGLLKKIEEGYVVITDRYYLSSYAYHSVYMSMDWVIQANAIAAQLLKPAVHIFIDIDPDISMQRIKKSRNSTELYETHEMLRKVREKYLLAISKIQANETVICLDGNLPENDLSLNITGEIEKVLSTI